jgi:glycosyltransferase involved in cell wall biosynthesis
MIEEQTLRHADRVLAINELLREQVVALGAPRDRTSVIGAGIDLDRFNAATDGASIRQKWGIDRDDVVLFFMGWLYHFSGLKEVAARLAEEANPRLKLLIVGEGDAFTDLERIRDARGLGDRMTLTGRVPYDDIPAFIAASDVCLLPADPNETIMQHIVPIKLYEYMAMGKPVLTTRLPGIMREFGQDNGVVYVEEREDVVTKALELTSQGQVGELGSRARSFVETYAWDAVADQFETTLIEAIEEKRNERHRERI